MTFFKYFFLLLLSFSYISCDDYEYETRELQKEKDRLVLLGEWIGTYTGQEDSGIIQIYINGIRGGGNVIMTSNKGFVEKFRCSISEYGQVNGTSPTIPLSIRGNLHEKKGNWKRGSAIGSWTISKTNN